jgi:hypothetical protein
MLKKRWVVAGILAGMVWSAAAQSGGPVCSLGNSFAGAFNSLGTSKAAYTVTVKSTREQRLSDGSYIRSSSRSFTARDGGGRLMMQMHQQCVRGEDGWPRLQYSVWVVDEKEGKNLQWEVGDPASRKEVRLTHMPKAEPSKEMTPAEKEARLKAASSGGIAGGKTKDLGIRTIAGLEAWGVRVTAAIPAGQEGNDAPLVSTRETWISKDDLGLVLLCITDDPRQGKGTYEVEEVKLGEPDAALFAPPEGYAIHDVKPVR